MNGINVKIDKLGRVVIPIKFRKRLGIRSDSLVSMRLEGDMLFLTSGEKSCAVCGSFERILTSMMICEKCANRAVDELNGKKMTEA